MRCLSKRVEDRFATAAELADQLQRYADQGLIGSVMQSSIRTSKLIGLPWTEPDLFGREHVIDESVSSLTTGNHPLLTLTGVGGIGKTQTAAAIARRLSHTIDCDVVWVDMAGVTDANQFAGSVLAAMEIPQQPNEPSPVRLAQSLAVRGPIVLVLDNLEQIATEAAEQIATWLSSNESLRVLATSQVPLRIRGEAVRVLSPLSTDESGDALALFSARAGTAKPGFELQPDTLEDAAEICRLVDGNPLAIELAAARVSI